MAGSSWRVVARCVVYAIGFTVLLALVDCGGGTTSASGPGLGPGTNNSMLHGQYAFSFAGQSTSRQGQTVSVFAVGTFTADGNGGITSGMEDANSGTGGQTYNFIGKYSVGSDLRGTAILSGLPVCSEWQFTMMNSSHALMTCFDTLNAGSGSIDIQDPTAFSTAKLTGNYVFGMSGIGINQSAAGIAGDWTMDGLGGITRGELDSNDGLSILQDTPLSGSYTVAANGKGTLQLNSSAYAATQNFVFYVVNANDLKVLENNVFSSTAPLLSGEVFQQAPGPYSLTSLSGGYVFTLGGIDSSGLAAGTGGVFTADGNGTISGILDDNDAGSPALSVPYTGTYGVGANGRALLTFSFLQVAAYPAYNGTLQLIELDGNGVSSGMAKVQTGAPFTTASLSGNFAFNWTGTLNPNSLGAFPTEEDITGQLTADGNGNLGGTLDVNSSSNLIQGLPIAASTYALQGSNGYGSAGVNTSAATFNMHYYQADANTALFLDIDNSRVLVGLARKQQ